MYLLLVDGMARVNQLCKNQRARKESIRLTRIKLEAVLHVMKQSSQRAIGLLGLLQNENELCLSEGNVICSKIQHAVVVCDPDSVAVAEASETIHSATCGLNSTSAMSVDVLRVLESFSDVSTKVMISQKKTNDKLDIMCDAHQHAFDVHEQAVEAIEKAFGNMPVKGIPCANCGGDAEPVYAARTGMCFKCVKEPTDGSGWTRCGEGKI